MEVFGLRGAYVAGLTWFSSYVVVTWCLRGNLIRKKWSNIKNFKKICGVHMSVKQEVKNSGSHLLHLILSTSISSLHWQEHAEG